MSSNNDFEIENGVLVKYTGAGGDVVIPDGVTRPCLKNKTCTKNRKMIK